MKSYTTPMRRGKSSLVEERKHDHVNVSVRMLRFSAIACLTFVHND